MSIASKLQRIYNAASAIKRACVLKGSIPSGGIETYADAVSAITGGGSGGSERTNWDVHFIDYDGTLLSQYQCAEGDTLTFPENPSHDGLIFDGWNDNGNTADVAHYGFTEKKDYVKRIVIGALYRKDETNIVYPNDTTIKICATKSDKVFYIYCFTSSGQTATIDWGDESTSSVSATSRTQYSHTYNDAGIYTITITGDIKFQGASNTPVIKNDLLIDIKLGLNVKLIGDYAFIVCYKINNITIPSSVTSIGHNAFHSCYGLNNVNIPSSVTSIGNYAFGYCYSLNNIIIPYGVTSIGTSAFRYCNSLISVIIPSSVTSIGSDIFTDCYALKSIVLPKKSFASSIISNNYYNLDYISLNYNCNANNTISYYNIPSSFNINNTSNHNNSKKFTVYPISTYIGNTINGNPYIDYCLTDDDNGNISYRNCGFISDVNISNKKTSIPTGAFTYCEKLRSVLIPSSVTSIGQNAFSYCYSLRSVNIPSSVTSIGQSAFQYCCSLRSVDIPSGVTSIQGTSFSRCYSLISVNIPSRVTSIGNNAFEYCQSLRSVDIPSSVTSIGSQAFQYCYSLISVNIPSRVTYIGDYVFRYCYSLMSVNIPSSVTSIGSYVFQNCYSLKVLNFGNERTTVAPFGNNMFSNCKIHYIVVPDDLYNTWYNNSSWTSYKDYLIKYSDYQLIKSNYED